MIEKRYSPENRLTLTMVEVVQSEIAPGQPGHTVVSIFEQSGHTDTRGMPYLVRGHVVTERRKKPSAANDVFGVEGRIANLGVPFATLDEAREGARAMYVQLQALWIMETVEAEEPHDWHAHAVQAAADERRAAVAIVDAEIAALEARRSELATARVEDLLAAARVEDFEQLSVAMFDLAQRVESLRAVRDKIAARTWSDVERAWNEAARGGTQ